MTSLQTASRNQPPKAVRFYPGTKLHDGLKPLSKLVEEPLVHIFNHQIRNKAEYIKFLSDMIVHHKLNAEVALQHVGSNIDRLIQKLVISKQNFSSRGAPMLVCGGGKGYFLPPSAMVVLKKLRVWIDEIDVHTHFVEEICI